MGEKITHVACASSPHTCALTLSLGGTSSHEYGKERRRLLPHNGSRPKFEPITKYFVLQTFVFNADIYSERQTIRISGKQSGSPYLTHF